MNELTVHFHELALKGGNRPRFERALRDNVRTALKELGPCKVRSHASRILVETEVDLDAALGRVAKVCGVAHAMRVRRFPRELEQVGAAVAKHLGGSGAASFRITTKRADKDFPLTSTEVDRRIGAVVHEATGLPVRLKGADAEIFVSVQRDEILVGYGKVPGPGGLPVGTGGRVAVLLSGGIDSPVAAWRMMRRGCRCDLVHFHSYPLVDKTTQEKARDLAAVLNTWQLQTRLHLVPLAEIQARVRVQCPEALRVILYRRFMMRLAEAIARKRRCGALVTGESLGQVASQTLENLATVDAVATLPVLRPLIGTDKQEIVAESQQLETYDISVQPDQDCCQLFVPRHPATNSSDAEAAAAEEALDVDALVKDALARTEVVDLCSEPRQA
jgi:thiamine biosynthesis protein ThiI